MKETKTLELKESVSNTFLKTVSAYANFGTGTILFGVRDDGQAVGLPDPQRSCLDIENRINDSISPKPDYSLRIDNSTKVVTLIVQEGPFKPYLYKSKAYRRSDTATVEVDQMELKRLILEGSNRSFEELPYPGKQDLTFKTLERELQSAVQLQTLTQDTLRTLGLLTGQGAFNNAGALLADRNEFNGIDIIRFGDTENEILERETCIKKSLLLQFADAMAIYRRNYQLEKVEGARRIRQELIPETAYREALANALVHRMWDIPANVQISMYTDRIEIVSPGGLPSGISETEYLQGSFSRLRNPVLSNVFFRLHIIEMFGTGIRRIRQAYAGSYPEPAFPVYENSLKVILPVCRSMPDMDETERKVYDLLRYERALSSSALSQASGIHRATLLRVVKRMVDRHIVQVTGRGRGTRYSLCGRS